MSSKTQILTRKLKRGETLLKPGDRLSSVFVVQSGELGVYQEKSGKMIQLFKATARHSIGEEAAFGPASWQFHVRAIKPSEVLEIPLDLIKQQLHATHAAIQPLIKGLFERSKATANELKTLKSNREIVSCPGTHTAKVFGVIFHVARALGTRTGDVNQVDWNDFKKFAFEVFDEPSSRLEEAIHILIKLDYVALEYPESQPQGVLAFKDMTQIEAFFDFYQNYFFKSGYADLLKTNEKATKVTQAFLDVASSYEADRAGNVQMPYKAVIEAMKEILGKNFEADQLFRLEQKGLFMKRTATQDGGFLSFYRPDYEQMLLNWKVLREVELWNAQGYVEIDEAMLRKSSTRPVPPENAPPEARSDQAFQDAKKFWEKRLESWKPKTAEGAIPQLRTGAPKAGDLWCPVCLSEMKQRDTVCEVCGNELSDKKAS